MKLLYLPLQICFLTFQCLVKVPSEPRLIYPLANLESNINIYIGVNVLLQLEKNQLKRCEVTMPIIS